MCTGIADLELYRTYFIYFSTNHSDTIEKLVGFHLSSFEEKIQKLFKILDKE